MEVEVFNEYTPPHGDEVFEDDLIRRGDLLEAIDEAFLKSPIEETTAWMLGRRIVRTFPSAELKKSKWLLIDKCPVAIPIKWDKDDDRKPSYNHKMECSNCGFQHKFTDGNTTQYRFCPSCGARMMK